MSRWAAVFVALSGSLAMFAAKPELPPAGMGEYLIVLWEPGTPMPGAKEKKFMRAVPEPDIEKAGGRVLRKHANKRLVHLSPQEARKLRRHEAVAYVQRIWVGEPLEGWDEREAAGSLEEALRDPEATEVSTLEWQKAYGYDVDGNIDRIGNDHYTYDAVGRLTQATVNNRTERYKYDSFGNLIERATDGGNPVLTPVDSASNRLMGTTYDAAGNATSRRDRGSYIYDSLNMIVWYTAPANIRERRILYDANDERIGAMYATNLQRWTIRDFDGQVIREFTGGEHELGMPWDWKQDYIRGEGQLLAGETQEWGYASPTPEESFWYGGKQHYHLDHLGSVRLVTNESGREISKHDYLPFGINQTPRQQEEVNLYDNHIDGMRFAGHWRDFMNHVNVDSTEYLDYMHARYYDPNLGRFLSVDPGRDWYPKEPQSWNLYTYARNNPTLLIDPDGRAVVLRGPNGVRFGTDANADGEADELQAEQQEMEWYAVVLKDGYGNLTHEAVIGYVNGTPARVYEHNAGWNAPNENVPFDQSLAAEFQPAFRKFLGAGFVPASVRYNEQLNRFFESRDFQCTDYSQFLQKRWFPPLLEAASRQRVFLGDRAKPIPFQQYVFGHYFHRFSAGYQRVGSGGW